jgi:hypothetical protein
MRLTANTTPHADDEPKTITEARLLALEDRMTEVEETVGLSKITAMSAEEFGYTCMTNDLKMFSGVKVPTGNRLFAYLTGPQSEMPAQTPEGEIERLQRELSKMTEHAVNQSVAAETFRRELGQAQAELKEVKKEVGRAWNAHGEAKTEIRAQKVTNEYLHSRIATADTEYIELQAICSEQAAALVAALKAKGIAENGRVAAMGLVHSLRDDRAGLKYQITQLTQERDEFASHNSNLMQMIDHAPSSFFDAEKVFYIICCCGETADGNSQEEAWETFYAHLSDCLRKKSAEQALKAVQEPAQVSPE